jgi:hypothetical protein
MNEEFINWYNRSVPYWRDRRFLSIPRRRRLLLTICPDEFGYRDGIGTILPRGHRPARDLARRCPQLVYCRTLQSTAALFDASNALRERDSLRTDRYRALRYCSSMTVLRIRLWLTWRGKPAPTVSDPELRDTRSSADAAAI